ncbi:glycosyltransferase [Patescibacteria group bacterium]
MKVALVYDRVNKFGGAERVLLALHKIWPQAPLFTAVYDSKGAAWASGFKVNPSFIQNLPFANKNHEFFPFLMPYAFEAFDFSDFDVVISVTSAEAKGIITNPNTLHLCYLLTPTRYLWSSFSHYIKNPRFGILNFAARFLMKPMLKSLQSWDVVAAKRPDYYISISETVNKRTLKYYQQKSDIIHPPVNTNFFQPLKSNTKNTKEAYFLAVSRLVSYKRLDIIIDAFNKLGLPLKIIGDGNERKILEKKAKANIEFLGQNLTDNELLRYYQNCACLVFSGTEDFGLVSLEAQACGKPVLGYKAGGIAETVVHGKTGFLFYPQTEKALVKAVKKFNLMTFSKLACRENALKFNEKEFIKKFKKYVEDKWDKHQKKLI